MTVEVLDLLEQTTELVDVTPARVELQDVVAGPPGPPGPPGGSALIMRQLEPMATWTWPHPLGRLPVITVYSDDGELVEPDVYATPQTVSLVFPSPYTGTAVLT